MPIDVDEELVAADGLERRRTMARQNRDRIDRRLRASHSQEEFTQQEMAIIHGPVPPWSQEDRDEESKYQDCVCPILSEVPQEANMRMWLGHVYDFDSIIQARANASTFAFRNPLTNEIVSPNQWNGDRPLTTREIQIARVVINHHNDPATAARRERYLTYQALQTRFTSQQNLAASRQAALNLIQQERAEAASQEEGNNNNNNNNGSDSDDESFMAAVQRVANNSASRNQSRRNRRTNNNNNNINPLVVDQATLPTVPLNLWGNPQVELAFKRFLEMCESAGFDTNLWRNKTTYLRNNIEAIFSAGGPFENFRPLSAAVFGTRLTRASTYFDTLLQNHNNDPTGIEGEERPLWFDVHQRYKIFVDGQQSRSARNQERREGLNDLADQLGANQPPLGPGNPQRRSEIAANNPDQLRGPEDAGQGIQVNPLPPGNDFSTGRDDDSAGGGETAIAETQAASNNRSGRRRANRSRSPQVLSRRNRSRIGGDGRSIQDTINDGRSMISDSLSSLADIANSIHNPPPGPPAVPLNNDPIAGITALSQVMRTVAQGISPEVAQATDRRLLASLHGLLNNYDQANCITAVVSPLDGAMAAVAATNNNYQEEEDD